MQGWSIIIVVFPDVEYQVYDAVQCIQKLETQPKALDESEINRGENFFALQLSEFISGDLCVSVFTVFGPILRFRTEQILDRARAYQCHDQPDHTRIFWGWGDCCDRFLNSSADCRGSKGLVFLGASFSQPN